MGTVRRKLLLGSFYKFVSSGMAALLGIITSVVINRHYGMEQYGLLVMVLTVTGFFSGFTNLGGKSTINRVLPQMMKTGANREEITRFIITAGLFLITGIAVLGSLIYFSRRIIADYYKTPLLISLLVIGVVYLFSFSLVDFVYSVYQALQLWFKEAIFSILYPFLFLGLIAFFIFVIKAGIAAVLYSNIMAALVTVAAAGYSLRERIKFASIRSYDWTAFKNSYGKFSTFGIPLLLPEVCALLILWADKFLLGRYSGAMELAVYYIAFNLIDGLMFFIKIPFTISLPHAAELTQQEEIEKNYQALFKINVYLSIGIALVSFFFIDWGVRLLYGPGYKEVALIFKLLLPVIFLKSLQLTPGIFMQNVYGMVKIINWGVGGFAVLNILLCLILIPAYGIKGAIAAIIAARVVYLCWVFYFIPEIKKLTPFAVFYRAGFLIVLLTGIYYLTAWLNWSKTVIILPLCLIIYIGAVLFFHELDFIFGKRRLCFANRI